MSSLVCHVASGVPRPRRARPQVEVAALVDTDQASGRNIPVHAYGINDEASEFTTRMTVRIFAFALFLASAVSIHANEPLAMTVSPVQSFAPANLTIRIHVEPNAGNRELEVVAECGSYYRSSRMQLDGAEAPRTISLEFRRLPGGDYDVRGVLIDGAGRERAAVRKPVIVLPSAGGGVTP